MLTFPSSTLVGRAVPKTAFYRNLELNARLKQRFVDDVAGITWTAKIAPSTLNVEDGKDVHEIVVFHFVLKAEDIPDDVFLTIDRQMPRHIIFLLQWKENYRLIVNYKEWHDGTKTQFDIVKTFRTEWMEDGDLSLKIEGGNMDSIYASLVRQVAGGMITSQAKDIQVAITETRETESLKRSIAALENALAKEKQPRKKFELHRQLLELKRKLK